MTFLNPLVLFGLAASAIPLLLHLLNLRKLQTIEFSTLAFLRELQLSKIRRLKLRQILLLIIRTLLIVAVVMAFARPALRGTLGAGFGSQANSTIVLILDDSYSMSARDEHGERFSRARETAVHLTELFHDGDEIYFLRLSDLPRATVNPAAHDPEFIRSAIRQSVVSPVRRTIAEAVRLAAELMKNSHNANREVYIVSDLQATQLPWPNPVPPPGSVLPDRSRYFLVRIGSSPVPNGAVDSAALLSAMIERGSPIRVSALIRNFNPAPLRNSPVSLFIDETRIVQHNCSADPWGSSEIEMDPVPKRAGILRGYIESEQDALEFDNRRYFTVNVPENVRVGLITSTDGDAKFLVMALSASQSDSGRAFWSYQQVPLAKAAFLDLRSVDVLVLQNLDDLPPSDSRRIAQFVRDGGGLLLYPSSASPDGPIRTTLTSELNLPPLTVEQVSGGAEGTKFRSVDLDHPIFSGMFENGTSPRDRNRELESPVISRQIVHEPGKTGQTIISTTGGHPFLTEYRLQNGKILLYAVPPVLAWSDFPVKGLFAPLLYRSLLYTADRGDSARSFYCGENPVLLLRATPELNREGKVSMIHPDGTEEIVRVDMQKGTIGRPMATAALPRLSAPGIYELRAGQTLLTAFAVNPDPAESDTRPATPDDVARWCQSAAIPSGSVTTLDEGSEIRAQILQSRFGVELWRYCVLAALLLAIAEMLIARTSRKSAEAVQG